MQDEIKHLNERINYLTELGLSQRESCRKRNQETRNKLTTCQNQNAAMFASQSNNQVCEQKLEGLVKINIPTSLFKIDYYDTSVLFNG